MIFYETSIKSALFFTVLTQNQKAERMSSPLTTPFENNSASP